MYGDLMSGRIASLLLACFLTFGLGGLAPVANAASAGQPFPKPGESARNNVIEVKQLKRRSRGSLFYLPIAPSYLAYNYPYYYARGHYPTHIRPGYVYYGRHLSTTPNAPIGTGYASPIGAAEKKTTRARKSGRRSIPGG